MAKRRKYPKGKKQNINAINQAFVLKRKYPKSEVKSVGINFIVWQGEIKPTAFSESYLIEVRYRFKNRPDVYVIEPDLIKDKEIPHTFEDGSLCLFRFKYFEWDSSMIIADTIIPWTALWLYYYELWLVCNEWLGGGEHPTSKRG